MSERHNPLNALKEERAAIASAIVSVEEHLKRLQAKLDGLDKAIANLEPLYDRPPDIDIVLANVLRSADASPGITEAVRMIFRSYAPNFLTPVTVRDFLKKDGLLKGYDNEMAVIHQVILRLEKQGQIKLQPGEKAYYWVEQNRQPMYRQIADQMAEGPPVIPPPPLTLDRIKQIGREKEKK